MEPADRVESDQDHDKLAEDFAALANATRLDILAYLTKPLYGKELGRVLGTSRQNAVKHVERLVERGFVAEMEGNRVTGPVIEYQVVPSQLFAVARAVERFAGLEPEGGPEIRRREPTQHATPPRGRPEPPPPATEPRLLLIDGPEEGLVIPLESEAGKWRIGRTADSTLQLAHDPFISAKHAEVQAVDAGHVVVDLGSTNGTLHNYRPLEAHERVELTSGDIVQVGHTRLVYQRP